MSKSQAQPDDLLWSSLASLAAQAPQNCDLAISGAIEMWSSMHRNATVAECVEARERICNLFGRAA